MLVKILDGKVSRYPYTVENLRHDNKNVSFPEEIPQNILERYGVFRVELQQEPEYNVLTHRVEHSNLPEREIVGVYTEYNAPSNDMIGEPIYSGRWVLTKTIVPLTEDQIVQASANAAANVRAKRDNLIAATDKFALVDRTLTPEMAAYRQALRDITDHVNFPYLTEADWPVLNKEQ